MSENYSQPEPTLAGRSYEGLVLSQRFIEFPPRIFIQKRSVDPHSGSPNQAAGQVHSGWS